MSGEALSTPRGVPISDTILGFGDYVSTEFECEAENLSRIINVFRENYSLSEPELEQAVRETLLAIFAVGAHPLQGSSRPRGWTLVTRFGPEPNAAAEAIIREWKDAGVDPDMFGLWFAHPSYYLDLLVPDSPRAFHQPLPDAPLPKPVSGPAPPSPDGHIQ